MANVPKFGNWDSSDNVPFTLVFEKARADKGPGPGNKIINPNDPLDNLSAYALKSDNNEPPSRRPPPPPTQPQHPEELGGRVDSGRGRPHTNGRPTTDNHFKRPSQGGTSDSEGSGFGEADNRSAEQSPSHPVPAFKGRLGNRPVSSSLIPKGSPDGSSSHHQAPPPAKTRFRPSSTEDMPDRTGALPKFGAWDEKDPTSGEGYTVIFSQARNEKKVGGPARIPALHQSEFSAPAAKTDYADENNQRHTSWLPCCFGPRGAT